MEGTVTRGFMKAGFGDLFQKDQAVSIKQFQGCKESPIKPVKRNVNKVLELDSGISNKFGKERYDTEELVTN